MNSLEKLKTLIELTPIYLANHFSDLKTQIDVAFAKKEEELLASSSTTTATKTNEASDSLVRLRENWELMIKKVNLYEKECMYRYKTNKLSERHTKDLYSRIEFIELNALDDEYLNDIINSEIDKLEKHFFLNKTIVYLNEELCDKFNILYKMDTDTTAGKLVIIKDLYLSHSYIKKFKK